MSMDTSAPLISVVLPAYNAAATLPEAVESILAQTWRHLELLIIDDGSTDETAAVLARFRDDRLRHVRRPHLGLVAALNHGLQLARGEFIARMDADDRSHPHRLATQLELLRHHSECAAAGCLVEMFPENEVQGGMRRYVEWLNGLRTPEAIRHNLFVEMPLLHPSMLLRAAAIRTAGGYRSGDFPEDYDVLLRLHCAGWQFIKAPAVLYYWREHPARLSRTSPAYRPEAFLAVKVKYLLQTYLHDERLFCIGGAGRDGKRLCRALMQAGQRPVAFLDIDPRKIGQRVYGIPVLNAEAAQKSTGLVLVCVGAAGARALIREALLHRGFCEGDDFVCLA